jgi:DMSO reductase anchor subunit
MSHEYIAQQSSFHSSAYYPYCQLLQMQKLFFSSTSWLLGILPLFAGAQAYKVDSVATQQAIITAKQQYINAIQP